MTTWLGLDQLHSALLSAIGALTTALGVLWRQNVNLRKKLDNTYQDRVEEQQAHVADVKDLMHETLELSRAALSAPALKPSVPPPPV